MYVPMWKLHMSALVFTLIHHRSVEAVGGSLDYRLLSKCRYRSGTVHVLSSPISHGKLLLSVPEEDVELT
jgi:hypothetical protein